MIDKGYVLTMARYNGWQNSQLRHTIKRMDDKALRQDRGAFFGSIFATLNHILWADTLWMSRWCSDVPAPDVPAAENTAFKVTPSDWDGARFRLDGRIRIWAQTLSNVDLHGTLSFHSATLGRTVSQPTAMCIAHMFNHQTHHRGQVHQMLSEAGETPPVSDLIFMPEDA
ncbi:DinB family protein [Sulfitobacter sp. HNIBRBA3233]|uniref:DinB family protein n=1 Tax=Sulfitobacter marinivivus TaxID=3158558 RepID=UPI0032DFB531